MGEQISGLIGPPMRHMAYNAAHLEGHKNGLLTNLVGWLGDSASCQIMSIVPLELALLTINQS